MGDLNLLWWRITLNQVRLPARMIKPVAITINGASRKESKLIKEWCKSHQVYLKTTAYFNDETTYIKADGTKYYLTYVNNERVIIGEEQIIEQLEFWLSTIPTRCYEVLLEDIDKKSINEIVKGSNARILSDINNDQSHIVSFDNDDLRVELILRSS